MRLQIRELRNPWCYRDFQLIAVVRYVGVIAMRQIGSLDLQGLHDTTLRHAFEHDIEFAFRRQGKILHHPRTRGLFRQPGARCTMAFLATQANLRQRRRPGQCQIALASDFRRVGQLQHQARRSPVDHRYRRMEETCLQIGNRRRRRRRLSDGQPHWLRC